MAKEIINKGKLFRQFVIERLKKPFKHPEYYIYFVAFVFAIGAIDIWTSIYLVSISPTPHDYQHVRLSIVGFSLVLITSGGIDLLSSTEKHIKRIIQFSALILIISGIVIFFVFFNSNSIVSFIISILLAVISLFVWWIANAENYNIINADLADEMSDEVEKLSDSLTDYEKS